MAALLSLHVPSQRRTGSESGLFGSEDNCGTTGCKCGGGIFPWVRSAAPVEGGGRDSLGGRRMHSSVDADSKESRDERGLAFRRELSLADSGVRGRESSRAESMHDAVAVS